MTARGHVITERERATKAAWTAAHGAAYRASHRDQMRAACRDWRARHPDAQRTYNVTYRASHQEEARIRSAIRRPAKRDEDRAQESAYWAARPDKKREKNRRTHARERGAAACNHAGCLVIGPSQLAWQTSKPVCYLCGAIVWQGFNLHMDHVVPIARGGLHCAENLRPACASCNQRKGAKLIEVAA